MVTLILLLLKMRGVVRGRNRSIDINTGDSHLDRIVESVLAQQTQTQSPKLKMKMIIVLAAVLACVYAAPYEPSKVATILRYDNDNIGVDGYNFA